jgi:hypothetical protein
MPEPSLLASILCARHPCVRIVTDEEPDAMSEVLNSAHEAKLGSVRTWTVTEGLRDGLMENAQSIEGTSEAAAALSYIAAGAEAPMLLIAMDLAPHLNDPRAIRAWRECIERLRRVGGVMVMIDSQDHVPPIVASLSTRTSISLPNDEDLESVVRSTLRHAARQRPVDVEISKGELSSIIANMRGLSRRQARQVVLDVISDDRRFDATDIPRILRAKRRLLQTSGLLEYVESPADMNQIGGLGVLKEWLTARERGFSEKARDFGIDPPRGMLLLGVQGAGKSLCAKAVATAWRRPLLRMDPGVLYDRYVGESEGRLRSALEQAEAMSPIILWIDEIEKAFASAASQSTDGGLSQRMFGSLLTWMQEHKAPVFLVATANNIEALPPELLRKGRFDEIFFVDLPSPAARRQIFEIHLKKRKREPSKFDIASLITVSEGYSGAEIEQAIVSSLHHAFRQNCDVSTDLIRAALEASPPLSVTMAERIADLRSWADGRCVPAE